MTFCTGAAAATGDGVWAAVSATGAIVLDAAGALGWGADGSVAAGAALRDRPDVVVAARDDDGLLVGAGVEMPLEPVDGAAADGVVAPLGRVTSSRSASPASAPCPADAEPCVEVRAPPEWDTVTPGATSTAVAEPGPSPWPMVGAAGAFGPMFAAGAAEVAVFGAAAAPAVSSGAVPVAWLVDAVVSPERSGLAHATPAGVAIAVPTPSATARAPTRPTNLLYCMTTPVVRRAPAVAIFPRIYLLERKCTAPGSLLVEI
ncbi:hypothetical protein ASD37_23305 [Mycobacterium sp. Root135]|nr:hypothetical protein ASD37_23305 [Mycobacterium sp. Root135]